MSRQHGQRVHIAFVKADGKRASFWADAPETWHGDNAAGRGWARMVTQAHSPGATQVKIIGKDRG